MWPRRGVGLGLKSEGDFKFSRLTISKAASSSCFYAHLWFLLEKKKQLKNKIGAIAQKCARLRQVERAAASITAECLMKQTNNDVLENHAAEMFLQLPFQPHRRWTNDKAALEKHTDGVMTTFQVVVHETNINAVLVPGVASLPASCAQWRHHLLLLLTNQPQIFTQRQWI